MYGGAVCHAHGGRAPQTRRAAARRVEMAKVRRLMERGTAHLTARRVALEPWSAEIDQALYIDVVYPSEQVKALRRIARKLAFVARVLRMKARMVEAEWAELQDG